MKKCDSLPEKNIEQRQFVASNETVKPELLDHKGESKGVLSIKLDGIISKYKIFKEELPQDDNCDTIILNNGDKYCLNIQSTGNWHIVYSKCESSDRAQYVILKKYVSSLIYKHGEVEKFWQSKFAKKLQQRENDTRLLSSLEKRSTELNIYESNLAAKYGLLAIISFFLIITIPFVFILCPLAFKYGKRVTQRREVVKGSKELRKARFGKAIGLAFYIGMALALLIGAIALAYIAFAYWI